MFIKKCKYAVLPGGHTDYAIQTILSFFWFIAVQPVNIR